MRKSCALTGHRSLPEAFDANAVYHRLEELIKDGCDTFFFFLAQGFDLLALECLADLKKKYPVFIEACIPFEGQERNYSEEEKQKYNRLLDWCDRKTVLYETYCRGCFLARDRYMADCADVVLAYCVKETGGTAYTVRYAEKKQIPVIRL